jgi:hypothetical protein
MNENSKDQENSKNNKKDGIEYFEISTEKYKKNRMERKTVKYEIKR